MTDDTRAAELIARAKELDAKATPGEWRNCEPSSNFQKGKTFIRPVASETVIATVGGDARAQQRYADAAFIAFSRTALPELAHHRGASDSRECRRRGAG